jgi:hypothetical protein
MSAKMVLYKDYVAGWLDSSIHDFLEVLSPNLASTKYALITCLDSNLDPASLREKSPELKSISRETQPLGQGLLLPTELLLQADSRNQLLFGFDELWFFPSKRIEPKPDSAWLVGPARIDQMKLNKLGRWMSRSNCSLALGDGDGLNFIIKAQGLVKYLLGHSIEQPQPGAAPLGTADSA